MLEPRILALRSCGQSESDIDLADEVKAASDNEWNTEQVNEPMNALLDVGVKIA